MTNTLLTIEPGSTSSADAVLQIVKGKLALETVHDFIAALRPEPAAYLILDLGGVTFLDSAGVGALVSLFVSRRNAGKRFALANLTPQSTAVIQVAGLTKLLPVYGSAEQAAAATA